jgi:hypothetical protein
MNNSIENYLINDFSKIWNVLYLKSFDKNFFLSMRKSCEIIHLSIYNNKVLYNTK